MAKTRSPMPGDDPKKGLDALTAAAQELAIKGGQSSLLYNSQVLDYILNNGGHTALAWHYWGKVPELRYTTRYIANALSVARLYVGKEDPKGGPPKRLPEDHPASKLLADFGGGQAGQSELLDRLALHLTVAGDSVLIGPIAGSGGDQEPFDQWSVWSTEEVYSRNGFTYVRMPGNSKEVAVPKSNIAVRIWRPHPVSRWDADSPVKGSFQVLRELVLFDDHVYASGTSRLAGAGFLGIPEEIDLPVPDVEVEGTEVDRFVALLTEVMGLAIKNRDSASALVPIILRGPAEYIDKIKHFDFHTEFSDRIPDLREGAIRRLALGMDVPAEVLLGSGSSTSWSAWQTDESTLRVHLIPLLQLITSSLTVGWLRPALNAIPMSAKEKEEIQDLVIHFDISGLKIRQDVSGDAQSLFDRFAIDEDALRLALGYGSDVAPDNKEIAKQIALKLIATGQVELVKYGINALRDQFGIKDLPEMKDPEPAPGAGGAPAAGEIATSDFPKIGDESAEEPAGKEGAPFGKEMPQETPEGKGPVPGERSQKKQVQLPPVPKVGDNSNNAVR